MTKEEHHDFWKYFYVEVFGLTGSVLIPEEKLAEFWFQHKADLSKLGLETYIDRVMDAWDSQGCKTMKYHRTSDSVYDSKYGERSFNGQQNIMDLLRDGKLKPFELPVVGELVN